MIKIIYIAFWFNSHWCSGAIQITPEKVSYWNDGVYVKELIEKKDYVNGIGDIIKTESGVIIVINKTKVEYFLNNKRITLYIKCQS